MLGADRFRFITGRRAAAFDTVSLELSSAALVPLCACNLPGALSSVDGDTAGSRGVDEGGAALFTDGLAPRREDSFGVLCEAAEEVAFVGGSIEDFDPEFPVVSSRSFASLSRSEGVIAT